MRSLLIIILALTTPVFGTPKHRRAKRFDWQDGNNGALTWANQCDWNGSDMSNVQSSGEDCGSICISTGGCTHFTWTSYNSGTCWLKKGSVSLDQAIYNSDPASVCGMLKSTPPPPVDPTVYNVPGTRWADSTDSGGCQMPAGNYAINNALALGQSSSLGYLVWKNGLCGQVVKVDCGGTAVEAVVASTCNLGSGSCGVDMITPTWNIATGNKPPGVASCSVQLTQTNPLSGSGPVCYIRPNSGSQAYYASLGVFNVAGRIPKSATAAGVNGAFQAGSGWFDFNAGGQPLFTGSAPVVFYFEDGSSNSFEYSDCKDGGQVHIWS